MFWSGLIVCAICDHEWVGTIELLDREILPIVSMECPRCHNMTGHPQE